MTSEPFERKHHQFIAQVLHALDGPLLREEADTGAD
jgi:hypothetical protein